MENQNYFVYKVDDDNIKLSKTFKDSKKLIPNIVGLGSTGGTSQSLSLINPQLISIKNNNLRFDLSDSSVSGYKLRFYYDQDYGNEFISSGISTIFNVVSVGIDVTINFTSSKSPDAKSEFVIDEKLSNKIISPLPILCAEEKVNVTTADPFVVENALVKVVVALIGCIS